MNKQQTPAREIRAIYIEETIRVYQAYSPSIAIPAVNAQTFVSPFKMERMTWIKPSFYWMMYRCGWAQKPGQERVLAIDIKTTGFDWALSHSSLSHFDPTIHASEEHWLEEKEKSCVRIQWDPERDPNLEKLEHRSIQIGLSGQAVHHFAHDWIVQIIDITEDLEGEYQQKVLEEERLYTPQVSIKHLIMAG